MKNWIATLTLISLTTLLAACNTMEGLGEDMQAGGENLEDAAEDNK